MIRHTLLLICCVATLLSCSASTKAEDAAPVRRLLYVATPGIRDLLDYGGKGIAVFDIDGGHQFVRRIALPTLDKGGKTLPVKGICASAQRGLLYISTTKSLTCVDLRTDAVKWEKSFDEGCDRMSISPDGTMIYLPSFEKDHWNVIDAASGATIGKVVTNSGSHNTVYGRDGKYAYLAGLRSPLLTVADTATHTAARTVGPFGGSVRPFTVKGDQTLCFACVNGLLGFEVGDLKSGKVLHRVTVPGVKTGPVARHGCPSHGIGMTPDEKEIWVADAFNKRVHIFDAAQMPPKYVESIQLRDEPGWVTFTKDGHFAYPSTGEVVETATRKIVAQLKDEQGKPVSSEKLLEIDFRGGEPIDNGDQFGIGRVVGGQ